MPLEYTTISEIAGPLVVVEQVREVHYDGFVEVETRDGQIRRGRVLKPLSAEPLSRYSRELRLDVTGVQGEIPREGSGDPRIP